MNAQKWFVDDIYNSDKNTHYRKTELTDNENLLRTTPYSKAMCENIDFLYFPKMKYFDREGFDEWLKHNNIQKKPRVESKWFESLTDWYYTSWFCDGYDWESDDWEGDEW